MRRGFLLSAVAAAGLYGCMGVADPAGSGAGSVGRGSSSVESTGNVVDDVILPVLDANGLAPHQAEPGELIRRMAIDLAGRVPTLGELDQLTGKSAGEIADFYMGLDDFLRVAHRLASDRFLYNNSDQFSRPDQIAAFDAVVDQLHRGTINYVEFTRQIVRQQMFLSRYPSPANRGEVSFKFFLGRDPFPNELVLGNMWNGFQLTNPNAAATDPDYHEYAFDATRCDAPDAPCSATVLEQTGASIDEAVEMLTTSDLFPEAIVNYYWKTYLGAPFAPELPELRRVLAAFEVANDFNVRPLIREIVTSVAYTQSYTVR